MTFREAISKSNIVRNPEWENGHYHTYFEDEHILVSNMTNTISGCPTDDMPGWEPLE